MTDTPRAQNTARLKEAGFAASRVDKAMEWEFRGWSSEEVVMLLRRLRPLESRGGSRQPCGPHYNRLNTVFDNVTLTIASYSARFFLITYYFPFQIGLAFYLVFKRRWTAILTEIPRPTLWTWQRFATVPDTFVKAPLSLIKKSIDEHSALCVNRQGDFQLMSHDYTIMSHVWGETMAWASTTGWGPVTLDLRKRGMSLDHLQRCIDQSESEWLWIDQIAMPEVFEDMNPTQKLQTERLRIDIINNLHSVYNRADKVMILDSALLRLRTSSLVDAAYVLSMGFWMTRLWPMTECRLARKVLLKTEDQSFDLDEIIDYLARMINNDQHRYYPLLDRLTPLRPTPPWSERLITYRDGTNPDAQTFNDIISASETRFTNLELDIAKALFPLWDIKWNYEWTLEDGLHHIEEKFPDQIPLLRHYAKYMQLGLHE